MNINSPKENFVAILNTGFIYKVIITKASQKLLNKASLNLPVEMM